MHEVQAHGLRIVEVATPSTLEEAVELAASFGSRARVMAGGTDLLLDCRRGTRPGVDVLIDLTRIPDLDRIQADGDCLQIGPLVTHSQVVGSVLVQKALPLAQACLEVGSPQLRNRATVIGNLVTASPANDTIPPLRALDAELDVASVDGVRSVPLRDFHVGVRRTTLAPGEIVIRARFRPLRPNERGVFVKLGLRRAQAISVVNAAVLVEMEDDLVASARIVLGSVSPVIISADAAESSLIGRRLDEDTIREAAFLAADAATPIDDLRATASYRKHAVAAIVERALTALQENRERSQWPNRPVLLSSRPPLARATPANSRYVDDTPVSVTVNGTAVTTPRAASRTLLDWLRDVAGPAAGLPLTGTKEGCAEGECGACTVLVDGKAVMSCLVSAASVDGSHITTVEGLSDGDGLHPLQKAFIDNAAVQCGYCTPGFLMAGTKLLEEHPDPTLEEIEAALAGNLCRCTGYQAIIAAVRQVAAGHAR